jgi:Fe-S oxidoreductase
MPLMQIIAIVISLGITAVALAFLVPAIQRMLKVLRQGQPAPGRANNPVGRTVTMLKETLLHTRMLQWTWVGVMHWFVFAAFIFLSTAVMGAYFQLFEPTFAWPVVGHWPPFEWFSELIGLLSTVGIIWLIIYRQKHHPRTLNRESRFYGSTQWQAYFVEYLALLEGAAILFIRGAEYNIDPHANWVHYPVAQFIAPLYPASEAASHNLIWFIAMFKIALAMVWLMVIARNLTMGIAWHRFTAWFNIFFKREDDGSTALGALKPLMNDGKAVTLDDIDDLDEDSTLGAGKIEDFSWKGVLDFTTCTECGRCQSQCPAWATEKPLSPKLMIMALRDHAYAKANGDEDAANRALVGKTETDGHVSDAADWFYNPDGGDFVIDEDALWSCTNCGACVQQCPVDIEHVDHFADMRRYQVLVESNFPAELNQLFKGLENKGNPWNMSPNARMDWAKDLPFEVKVVGDDIESLDEVEWLFWVGCAGAYEDRAKKTTRAVAELLDMAGVSFGVLGNGETCTGDSARRAGNEFVFQGLAQQNVETFKEYKVKKVVSTCAHCFNTLKNEYKDFGIELEVVHHTQLLNRLVREGKLTPVKEGEGAHKRSITYHDPCFLGRHNQVYSPPRDLLQILPGAEYKEMERANERSFCCGAGGARMWMEENIGERINLNRTEEAVGTGADQIAVGCPFCRVMLADGLTKIQADGAAREEVEVLDVAQMLLASVKGEVATKAKPGAAKQAVAAGGAAAAAGGTATAVATKDEPETGDVTMTSETVADPADVGPNAKASEGSLFDSAPAPEAKAEPASGGSLFDTPAPAESKPAESKPAEAAPASGGSLFDVEATEAPAAKAEAPAEKAAPAAEAPAEAEPAADLGGGGSLFDVQPTEAPAAPAAKAEAPATEAPAEETPAAAEAKAPAESAPAQDVDMSGSLFDIQPTEAPAAPAAKAEAPAQEAPAEEPTEAAAPAEAEQPEAATSTPATAPEASPSATSAPAEPAASTGATSTPRSDVDIHSASSLFDIEAPAASAPAAAAPAAAEAPANEAPATEAPAEATEAPAAEEAPAAGGEFDQAADSAPAEEATATEEALVEETAADQQDVEEGAAPATEAAEEAPAPEATEATEEKAAEPATAPEPPKSSGEKHTPRTDADIHGAGSLFDL